MEQFLEPIGITLDVKELERTVMYNKCNDMNEQVAFCAAPGWFKDYADGYTFGNPLFTSDGLWESCCNYSGLGASADQLRGWGYDATEVPSVDDKAAECTAATGDDRVQCWAETRPATDGGGRALGPVPVLQPGRPLVPQHHELLVRPVGRARGVRPSRRGRLGEHDERVVGTHAHQERGHRA